MGQRSASEIGDNRPDLANSIPGTPSAVVLGMEQKPQQPEQKKPGDKVKCPRCGATLVLVSNRGLWACDPGTKRRHACLDDRRGR